MPLFRTRTPSERRQLIKAGDRIATITATVSGVGIAFTSSAAVTVGGTQSWMGVADDTLVDTLKHQMYYLTAATGFFGLSAVLAFIWGSLTPLTEWCFRGFDRGPRPSLHIGRRAVYYIIYLSLFLSIIACLLGVMFGTYPVLNNSLGFFTLTVFVVLCLLVFLPLRIVLPLLLEEATAEEPQSTADELPDPKQRLAHAIDQHTRASLALHALLVEMHSTHVSSAAESGHAVETAFPAQTLSHSFHRPASSHMPLANKTDGAEYASGISDESGKTGEDEIVTKKVS